MPKETKNITLFNAGLITNPDINDIPDNAFTTGTVNIKSNAQGKVIPAKGASALSAISGFSNAIYNHGWIREENGQYNLVYDDGTNIKVIKDFYGTPSVVSLVSSADLNTIAAKNQSVHIGTGNTSSTLTYWSGYIGTTQFGRGGIAGYYTVADRLFADGKTSASATQGFVDSLAISGATTGGTTTWQSGTQYIFGVSCEYNGYMESPIAQFSSSGNILSGTDVAAGIFTPSSGYSVITLTLNVDNFSSFNKRVSKIHLWVKENAGGLWRLLKEIDVNNPGRDTWTDSGVDVYWQNIAVGNDPQESYEAYTGISQEVTRNDVNYSLSEILNDHLFVANGYSYYFADDKLMLYRSQEGAYSMFDVQDNLLKLPEIPTALKAFNGKLYAFTSNNIYRINFNLFIEDVTEGIGCVNSKSVVVTEYGMFWADDKGVYQLSNGINEISAPIRNLIINSSVGIDGLVYDAQEKQILVLFNNEILAFNVLDKTWSKYSITTIENLHHMFNGKDGESYISYEDSNSPTPNQYTDKLFTGSNLTYTAISKEFDMEDPSQEKRFYKLIVDYTGTAPTVQYSTNGGSSFTTLTAVSTGVYEIKSSGNWVNAKTIMFKFSGTATINSYSVIFRRFIGRTHV